MNEQKTKLRLIQGDREKLEREVIKMLLDPKASLKEIDEAIRRLNPLGQLELIASKQKKKERIEK